MSDRKGKVKSDKERKKSEIDSEAEIDGKKKKKMMKVKDYCDVEKESEREKLGDETVTDEKTLKNKKIRDDSEAEDVRKKKKMKENDSCDGENLGDETVMGKKTKKNKEIRADSEVEDDAKKKMKKKRDSGDDEIESNESFKIDARGGTGKRKRDDFDLRDEEKSENFTEDTKEKRKKKRRIEDSEVQEDSKESTKDAKKESKKKKKKQSEELETEESNKELLKDSKKKKKQSEGSEVEEGNKDSKKDAKKKRKKKVSEDPDAEQNMESMEDGKKKRKKKQMCSKSDENVTTPSSKSVKRVKFSDQVEVFPIEDEEMEDEEVEEEEMEEAGRDGLVRGKRFTKEEDELIKKSVLEYIEKNGLGDKGLNMVMKCSLHPEVRGCWKQITSVLPWRPELSIYYRAHILFEGGSKGVWTQEELEYVKTFKEKHGPDWKTLADALGKHRWHVKDAWRRIRLTMNKGKWSREEYQTLFDLVNNDLRLKAFEEKQSKHGMLRDNIRWTAISDKVGTRNHVICCKKWYEQLTSPMVKEGTWANVDDYRLLDELTKLDATCIDDVDWDTLLENRDGEICRKRWNQMVLHIGVPGTKTFAEQVEILSERYCPDLAEEREEFDNRPYDPETSPGK